MEINSSPSRLDLKDVHVHRARELGVPLVISTDSHTVEALDNVRYGIAVANRGWCEPRHVLNTMSVQEFTAYLALGKSQRRRSPSAMSSDEEAARASDATTAATAIEHLRRSLSEAEIG